MLNLALLLVCVFSEFQHTRERVLDLMGMSEEEFADLLFKSEFAAKVPEFDTTSRLAKVKEAKTNLPLVFAHGMGDSCFNSGMKQITELSGQHVGVTAKCIPTGNNRISDTNNGFFMTMDDNVDEFAKRIRAEPTLANGFHGVGFSQGNMLIRGYIHKYNDPPVNTWLSVHGTVMGVAGFPHCNPDGLLGPVCKLLTELLGDLAYAEWVQNFLFQADYFRDPMRVTDDAYLSNSEIAQWNQENSKNTNFTWKANFVTTKAFAMIKAKRDTMIYPNDSEWWGQFAPGSLKDKQEMKDTELYKTDAFGLRTVDEAGKIVFNTTEGNHLQFSQDQLFWWLDHYLKE